MNKFTYLNLWVGKKLTQLKRKRAGREWWHSRWSREAGAAWGSGRWYPGRECQGSKRSKPSASSRGSPSLPIPRSPWSYSDRDDHSPDSKNPQVLNIRCSEQNKNLAVAQEQDPQQLRHFMYVCEQTTLCMSFCLRVSSSTQNSTKYFTETVKDSQLRERLIKYLQVGDVPEGTEKESLEMESHEQRKSTPPKKSKQKNPKSRTGSTVRSGMKLSEDRQVGDLVRAQELCVCRILEAKAGNFVLDL